MDNSHIASLVRRAFAGYSWISWTAGSWGGSQGTREGVRTPTVSACASLAPPSHFRQISRFGRCKIAWRIPIALIAPCPPLASPVFDPAPEWQWQAEPWLFSFAASSAADACWVHPALQLELLEPNFLWCSQRAAAGIRAFVSQLRSLRGMSINTQDTG